MVRIIAGVAAVAVLSACASTPQAPQERILGLWSCSVNMGGLVGVADLTYRPDGTSSGPVSFKGDADGVDVDIAGDVNATWDFLPDGQLRETVTAFSIRTASFDGEVLSDALIEAMIQPMIAQTLEGQESIANVAFGDRTMTLALEGDEPTRCSR